MNKKTWCTAASTVFVSSLLVFSGCSKSQAPPPTAASPGAPSAAAPSAPAVSHAVSAEAGTITGKVLFKGIPPVMKVVNMVKEASCAAAHKAKPQHEETVVVNPNKTLRYAVVYLKSPAPSGTSLTNPVELDQKTCWYMPHILAVMTGQPINVVNSDAGVLHNIHFMPKLNTPLNFGQPGPAPGASPLSRTVSFSKPEMIPVKCDVHSWMHAWVAVFSNPYFAVTDDKGNFTIKNVPPGKYTLEAWQEKYGTKDMPVTVGKKQTKTVTFAY